MRYETKETEQKILKKMVPTNKSEKIEDEIINIYTSNE